ncbi:MAG TPA: hypothetical protein VGL24_10485 [Chthoniobacterales bacterium]
MVALLACGLFATSLTLQAGETEVPKTNADGTAVATDAAEEPTYDNWIELGLGGIITNGDAAQFKQEHHQSGDLFGGIQDFHYEQKVGKKGQFSLDAHAIFDNHDYDVKLELSQPDLGYIRAGYTEFRTWYDGNGGYFPLNGQFFPPPFGELHLDRGEAWVELGLRLPDWPEITVRYSHQFREGQKDSTSWGDTALTGVTVGTSSRKIAPAYRDIDESRDILAVDIAKTLGNTDFAIGMRYEHDDNNDRLQLVRSVGAPNQRFITQQDQNQLDLFSGHATTETHFSDALWLTTAYSYTTLGSDIAGSRIYGPSYNSSYSDPITTLGGFDHGYLNLVGTSDVRQHVVNLNLRWLPAKDFTVLTAFRFTNEEKQSDSVFLETSTRDAPLLPMAASSFENFNTFAETLELRYTGLADWLLYGRGDWEQQSGDIHESIAEIGMPALAGIKNLDLYRQKYTVGFNWYPAQTVNFAGQYYHKIFRFDNTANSDGQRLEFQEWNTDNMNIRMTWRPRIPLKFGTLALVTRYDFTTSSVVGQWAIPDDISLASEHTALISNHVISESATWSPLARLYLQGNFSYVLNETKTPGANIEIVAGAGPSVLNFQNDYWTLDGSVGYLINDKTDLRVSYSYYRANDYVNNALASQPYGSDATEHTASATLSRQLTKRIRLQLQYSYFHYTDGASGGFNNYEAHSIFSTLAFAF